MHFKFFYFFFAYFEEEERPWMVVVVYEEIKIILKNFDILNKIEFTINSLNVGFFEKLLGKIEKLSVYTKININFFLNRCE